MGKNIQKIINNLSGGCFRISMWGTFVMMLLIIVDITLRAAFNTSTLIAEEISGYLFVFVVYFGLAETLKKGRHVKVELITERIPHKVKMWLNPILAILALSSLGVVFWRTILMVCRSYSWGTRIPGPLDVPVYLPQSILVIGLFLLIMQYILQIITEINSN